MRELAKLWPIGLLVVVMPLHLPFFNTDLVVAPYLIFQGFSLFQVLVMTCLVSFGELWLGYIGWSGLTDLLRNLLSRDIDFAKKIAGEMKANGTVDEIKVYFAREHNRLSDSNGKIFKRIKRGGLAALFTLGVVPTMGTRLPADIICGTMKWRSGFVALAIGNFLKNVYFVLAWKFGLNLFH